MNPVYSKKGVFTSYSKNAEQTLHPNQPQQSKKEQIFINRAPQTHISRNNLPHPLTVQELNAAKFSQSNGYPVQRPDIHFNYNPGAQSNFVPPPPQRFIVNSGHSYNHLHTPPQVPIFNGGQVQTVQTVQPLYQSIKRTYVPHHIYNEIPILNSETKHYVENQEEIEEEPRLDESDEKMLEMYDNLYQKYLEVRQNNQNLERRLRQSELRKETEPAEVREIIQTKEVLVDKPKKIDIKLLASLLIKKNQAVIDQIVQRRKNSCISKLRALLSEEELAIKTTIIRSTEEYTQSKLKIK